MYRTCFFSLLLFPFLMNACHPSSQKPFVSAASIARAVATLVERPNVDSVLIDKGVRQVARLWQPADGSEADFVQYCIDHAVASDEKEAVFLKISQYLEAIEGHLNELSLQLQRNLQEDNGPLHPIDESFAAYSPGAHLSDDFYANQLAFFMALNFPQLSLEEKEALGDNRLAWAYARLGDRFVARIPAEIQQRFSQANSDADHYISSYNIYAGHLLNRQNEKLFPKNMILLSHWNLRDEIKSNYQRGAEGLDKQQTLYEVMKRIVAQEIPQAAIDSGDCEWNPFTNTLFRAGEPLAATPENTVRYEKILNNFKALQAMDPYTGKTYIERHFSDDMEMAVADVETLLRQYLAAPEMKIVAEIIARRLGRPLQAFDIWYDGFKSRSHLDENQLSAETRQRYPDAAHLEQNLPKFLIQLGFSPQRAEYLAEKIAVDAARGSGHAWGAAMKGQKSHLRTRIADNGLDYNGYNIAIHEFGHNVEQTLSLYDVDYYLLSGVPNTAFTEALAFVFQKRDLELLGIPGDNAEKTADDILDKAWHLYEIAGVSLFDISLWQWLYQHPDADAEAVKAATLQLSRTVWNEYFAPVIGPADEPVLAIYSHTVSYPLYLPAYAFGHIIQFQLEQHLSGKNFAGEVERIFRLGRLTPRQWMLEATGSPLSVEPILAAVRGIRE
jgi:hypothetical protein